MATEPMPALLSYDDYAAIGDDRPAQVVDGVLVLTPSATPYHQDLVGRIWRELVAYAEREGGRAFFAPLDVVLKADRPAQILQPDVIYVSPARLTRVTPQNVQGAPDVVVEVLSPSNMRVDTGRKKELYARHGVGEYWLVPWYADRIEVLVLDPDGRFGKPLIFEPGDALTSAAMPGFALDVAAVFRGLTPPEA